MTSYIPQTYVEVTRFASDDDRDGLASDQEWEEEIQVRS
jgi:hypothetical protein